MNLSPLTVNDLRREGWDIVRVSSLLAANAPDSEILTLARRQEFVIVTQDLDFSALLALGGYTYPSVVTLRLTNTDPDVVTARLKKVMAQITDALSKGCIVTVNDTAVRIRQLPI